MMVHEFQAKELLSCYGLVSPGGKVAITGQEAENIARGFSSGSIVVKAQVHAGGRGRAGGVIVVNSPEQAKSAAEKMLGQRLVTDQTGPLGRMTKRVYIERAIQARRELMIALLVDTTAAEFVVIGSAVRAVEEPTPTQRCTAKTGERVVRNVGRSWTGTSSV